MALNPDRTPVRPARGPIASLLAELQNFEEGELVWASDERQHWTVFRDELGVNELRQVVPDVPEATTSVAGLLSAADKTKLNSLSVLTPATTTTLGGVKGDGATVAIDPDGTLRAVGGGPGGGSVTLVSGTSPVQVANGTTTPSISVLAATTSAPGIVQLADSGALTAGTAGRVVDAAGLLGLGLLASTRQVLAGTGLTGGGPLSADVTLSAQIASEAQAIAGADNTLLMTPLRVAQATGGSVTGSRQVLAGTGLTGGGPLSSDVTLSAVIASNAQALAGASNTALMSPQRTGEAITNRITGLLNSTSETLALSAAAGRSLNLSKVDVSTGVTAGSGLTGGGNLSTTRQLAADYASEADAIAGLNNTRLMTPLRVAQAFSTQVPETRLISSGTGLTGGGDLSADRTLALTGQALALHQASTAGFFVRTAGGAITARSLTGSGGINVGNGDGSSGNPAITPAVATTGQAQAGSANDVLMTPLRTAEAIAALSAGAVSSLEVFTVNGTFNRNTDDVLYWVEVIGGSGSGAKTGNSNPAGGGGGGGYDSAFLLPSQITASVSVTVGSGGAAVNAVGGADGNPGGLSSFGGYLEVYGGRGGTQTGAGGFGGGPLDPSILTGVAAPQGVLGGLADGQPSVFGGGAGNGGASVRGGGGGGRSTGAASTGGNSRHAGSGGDGGTTSSGIAGQVPGGGGGGTQTGSASGAGARGEVRVYRIKRRP